MRTMLRIAASTGFITLSLAACGGDEITGASGRSPDQPGLATSVSVERPWKATCDVNATAANPATPWILTITGTCQMAHFGQVDVLLTQIISAPDANGVIAFTNVGVYTAANGDVLNTTMSDGTATFSQVVPGDLALAGTEVITGGTGRFAGAAGDAALTGKTNILTDPTIGYYRLAGNISY